MYKKYIYRISRRALSLNGLPRFFAAFEAPEKVAEAKKRVAFLFVPLRLNQYLCPVEKSIRF